MLSISCTYLVEYVTKRITTEINSQPETNQKIIPSRYLYPTIAVPDDSG